MADNEDKTNDADAEEKPSPLQIGMTMKCADIQPLLTDYMMRELGESRSALVRAHIRNCEKCQVMAKEMAEALNLLRDAGKVALPDKLSDDHRARIRRAYTHPFMSWVETHHTLVSIIAGVVLVFVVLAAMFVIHVIEKNRPKPKIVPIIMRRPGDELDDVSQAPEPVVRIIVEPTVTDEVVQIPGPIATDDQAVAQPEPVDAPETKPPEDKAASSARWLANLRKNRVFGGISLGLIAILVGLAAWFIRKAKARGAAEDEDGTTNEGPPPFE